MPANSVCPVSGSVSRRSDGSAATMRPSATTELLAIRRRLWLDRHAHDRLRRHDLLELDRCIRRAQSLAAGDRKPDHRTDLTGLEALDVFSFVRDELDEPADREACASRATRARSCPSRACRGRRARTLSCPWSSNTTLNASAASAPAVHRDRAMATTPPRHRATARRHDACTPTPPTRERFARRSSPCATRAQSSPPRSPALRPPPRGSRDPRRPPLRASVRAQLCSCQRAPVLSPVWSARRRATSPSRIATRSTTPTNASPS